MTKPKLLWISDDSRLPNIGQSIVTRECLTRLMEHYEVEQLGFGGAEIKPEHLPVEVPYKITPCNRADFLDAGKTVNLINEARPDVVFFSHDPWLFQIIGYVKASLPHIKYMGYLTFDGEPPYHRWIDYLRAYDKIISPAHYGAKVVKDRWCDLNVGVVPYGINHNVFHSPQQGKELLKTQLTQASGGGIYLDKKFFAIFIGANQDRKNLGLLHETWKRFEAGKEGSVTLLILTHSASLSEQTGSYDLSVFLQDTKTLGIIDRPQDIGTVGRLMASADILTHFSSGEGVGLTQIEAMACGTVPVVLNYAGATDFCNSSNCYEVPYILHPGGYHVNRALADPNEAAKVLDKAYDDWKNGNMAKKAIEGIKTAQKYTWEKTAEGLKAQIDEVLSYSRDSLFVTQLV